MVSKVLVFRRNFDEDRRAGTTKLAHLVNDRSPSTSVRSIFWFVGPVTRLQQRRDMSKTNLYAKPMRLAVAIVVGWLKISQT